MWFIGVEVEQETSAPPPKKNPGSAPENLAVKTKDAWLKTPVNISTTTTTCCYKVTFPRKTENSLL